jgi:hypothetical protein
MEYFGLTGDGEFVEELQGVVDDNISLFANGPLPQRRLRLFCRSRAVL